MTKTLAYLGKWRIPKSWVRQDEFVLFLEAPDKLFETCSSAFVISAVPTAANDKPDIRRRTDTSLSKNHTTFAGTRKTALTRGKQQRERKN